MPAAPAAEAKVRAEDRLLVSLQQGGPPHEAMPVSLRGRPCTHLRRGTSDGGDDFPPEPNLAPHEFRPGRAAQAVELVFANQDASEIGWHIVDFEGIPEFCGEFPTERRYADGLRAVRRDQKRLVRRGKPVSLLGPQCRSYFNAK